MEPTFATIGISRLRMLNDGEGVTTLAAGYGCPLRCRYCLNPQCFAAARPVRTYTVRELIEEVRVDDLYFLATGGGVVFGGGEPLLQADFIHAFRREAPKEWKLGLESSLAVPSEQLQKVLEDIDYYLIDIKDMDPEIYRAYTGQSNRMTLANLKLLSQTKDFSSRVTVRIPLTEGPNTKVDQDGSRETSSCVTVRIPLIEGFNTEEDQDRSQRILEEMGFTRFDRFRYNIRVAEEKRQIFRPDDGGSDS